MAKFNEISHEVTENWEHYPLLLAVKSDKKGRSYAYVTFSGLARPYDNADNIRGNTFVLCPSRFRIKTTSYYQITNGNLLYDYVACRINKEGKSLEDIDVDTEKDKKEQLSELRDSNDEFKKLFPKEYDGIRKTFDICLANIANDNFADLTKTKENIGELKDCLKKIIDDDTNKYSLKYEGEKRHCLPWLYNIEIANSHDSDKNAYLNITYIFLEKLHKFLEKELLLKALQQFEVYELFLLKNNLNDVMFYASGCIGYLQWKRLYEHLNKLLMPQTFLGKMYKTVCFSDSEFKEYIENLPGIVSFVETDNADKLDICVDYFINSSGFAWIDEDNWIQVINKGDFDKDKSPVKKYLDGLKKYSGVFKLSTIQVFQNQEEYKYYDAIDKKLYNIGVCANARCDCLDKTSMTPTCTQQSCTHKKVNGSDYKLSRRWQKSSDSFFYNNEALNTLKNLFAVRVLYETNWYEIAKKNRTFISKAIRIFCETVMLALYRSGYIPAFYFEEKTVKGIKKRNIIEYFENTKKDEERITSSAVNFKFAKKFIEKLDPTVQASMKSIVRRLDILLQRTNPDMHGAEYFPRKHQLDRMLDYMQDISKEAYQLLDKKKSV